MNFQHKRLTKMIDEKLKAELKEKSLELETAFSGSEAVCYWELFTKVVKLSDVLEILELHKPQSLPELQAEFEEKFAKHCPSENNCNNEGTLSEHGCDGTEEDCQSTCPIPVQCEFCYSEPLSIYNVRHNGELWNWFTQKLEERERSVWDKAIKIIYETMKQNPYKQESKPETDSEYNMGWTDVCAVLDSQFQSERDK